MTRVLFVDYDKLVVEILDTWKEFIEAESGLELDKSLRELLTMILDFCQDRDYKSAQDCCRVESEVLKSDWDLLVRKSMDFGMADGVLEFCWGTTYVGLTKLDTALDHYKASAERFSQSAENVAAATVWFCIGKIYVILNECPKAIWALQRSLNHLSPRDPTATKLNEKIEGQFVLAKEALLKKFKTVPKKPKIEVTPEEENAGVRKIHIVRKIAAGSPHAMGDSVLKDNVDIDNVFDTLLVDNAHLKGAELGLLISGSSMIDGGILNGDYALIRLVNIPNNGEIVAVAIFPDGEGGDCAEATLKKYYREEIPCLHHHLQPMNTAEPHILVIPQKGDLEPIKTAYAKKGINIQEYIGEVNIIGKLVSIWRKVEK
jgi:SOS-response transcriptional repressor LexA